MPNIDPACYYTQKFKAPVKPFDPKFIGPTDLTWLVKLFKGVDNG
jgi:hypothetical protein